MNKIILVNDDMDYIHKWLTSHSSASNLQHIPFKEVMIEAIDTREHIDTIPRIYAEVIEETPLVVRLRGELEIEKHKIYRHIFVYNYDTKEKETIEYWFNPNRIRKDADLQGKAEMLSHSILITYTAVMGFFANASQEIIASVSKQEIVEKKRKGKRPKVQRNTIIQVSEVRKVYRSHNEKKRTYTKPTHSVPVRGFWRHYKSGKVGWVRESKRYKDKPDKDSVYTIGGKK